MSNYSPLKINRQIGVAMLIVVIALVIGVWSHQYLASADKKVYRVRGVFDNIGGLVENSPVQVSGVVVGMVKRIRLLPNGQISVVIEMLLTDPLPVDSVLAITSTTLTGDAFMIVYSGKARKYIEPFVATGDRAVDRANLPRFMTINFMSLGNFADMVGEMVGKIQEISRHLAFLFSDAEDGVPARIQQLQVNSNDLYENFSVIGSDIKQTIREFKAVSAEMNDVGEKYGQITGKIALTFPENTREEMRSNWNAAVAAFTDAKNMLAEQRPLLAKIRDDEQVLLQWKNQLNYSPHSVIGVLLADPHYSVDATLKVITDAYHSVTDKSLFAKLVYFVGGFLHGRNMAKNFIAGYWRGGSDGAMAEFHREYLRLAAEQKANFGYIKSVNGK